MQTVPIVPKVCTNMSTCATICAESVDCCKNYVTYFKAVQSKSSM